MSTVPGQRIGHLDDDERAQRHARRVRVVEDVAVDALEALVLHQALRLVSLERPIRARHI